MAVEIRLLNVMREAKLMKVGLTWPVVLVLCLHNANGPAKHLLHPSFPENFKSLLQVTTDKLVKDIKTGKIPNDVRSDGFVKLLDQAYERSMRDKRV